MLTLAACGPSIDEPIASTDASSTTAATEGSASSAVPPATSENGLDTTGGAMAPSTSGPMTDSSADSSTGEPPDCEDSGIHWVAELYPHFGDWPPTGTDALGDATWDVDVACTYAGVSPAFLGVLLSCDDAGAVRQVDLQYAFEGGHAFPSLQIGEPVQLRAHTGFGENWAVLSRPSGEVLVLGIFGDAEHTLQDQDDYAPFSFSVADVCPVAACGHQLGLDITVAKATTRVFEGPPVDLTADDGTPYRVMIQDLLARSDEIDPDCPVGHGLAFVIVRRE